MSSMKRVLLLATAAVIAVNAQTTAASTAKQTTKYKPASVQEAWDNHFKAFADQNLDQIMLDYTEESELVYYAHPGGYTGLKGLKDIRAFFKGLFAKMTDLTDLAAPVVQVTDLPAVKQVFLVWSCPSSGVQSATDTFIFDKDNKIRRQNIHYTKGTQKPAYKDITVKQQTPAKDPVKLNTKYKAPSVAAAFYNHFMAVNKKDIVRAMEEYIDETVFASFDHTTGILITAKGRAQIQTEHELYRDSKGDTRGLKVLKTDVTNQVFMVWEYPTATPGLLSSSTTWIMDKDNKIIRANTVYTSGDLTFEYEAEKAICPKRGFWESGCGQPKSKASGKVVCMGKGLSDQWSYGDEKCKGTKPAAMTTDCPATPPCPRCKGCKRSGDCFKACGEKAGMCAACDSKDGRAGACCRAGSASDPIECRMSEPQLFSGVGKQHTCALLPGDAHVASLIKGVIERIDTLEGDVKNLRKG